MLMQVTSITLRRRTERIMVDRCVKNSEELLRLGIKQFKYDRLREKGIACLLLCHATVERYPNPEGPDYDRYQPALNRKHTWSATAKWADMILFGCLDTTVTKEAKAATKGKATGGETRIIRTEAGAAYVAKNRHGLPNEIECGTSAKQAWENFQATLKGNQES